MRDWCVNTETVRLQDSLVPVAGDELAGPKKTPFLCPQGRVVHARGRVVLS